MTTTFTVELDTDKDGTFDAAVDNITAYVIELSTNSGFGHEMAHTANVGQCFLVVNNADRRFSPAYTAGPLYGKLLPYLPVRIRANVDLTYDSGPLTITPAEGVELLANPSFSAWTADNPDSWTVGGEVGSDPEVTERDSGQAHADAKTTGGSANLYASAGNVPQISQIVALTAHQFYAFSFVVSRRVAGSINSKVTGASVTVSAAGTYSYTGRAQDDNYVLQNKFAGDNTLDSASVKALSATMQLYTHAVAYGDFSATLTIPTAYFQGGVVFNYTDANNFAHLYYDRLDGKVYLTKWVSGVFTEINSWTAAYAAGATLMARRYADGTLDVIYNDATLASGLAATGLTGLQAGATATNSAVSISYSWIANVTYTLFRGYAMDFIPDPGVLGLGQCLIPVEDALSIFQRETIEIPPQIECTADRLIKMIGSDVFKTAACIDQLGIKSNPSDGDTFVFGSVNYGTITYILKNTMSAANHVQIGATKTDTAANLVKAINGDDDGLDTAYFQGTAPLRDMTATGATTDDYGGAGFDNTGTGALVPLSNTSGAYQVLTITTAEAGSLSRIGWSLGANVGTPTGDIRVTLRNTPPTQTLGTKDYIFTDTFTPTPSADELVTLSNTILLTPGTWYLQISCVSDQTAGNYYQWVTGTGGGTNCQYYDGSAWQAGSGNAKCTSVVSAVTDPYLITLTATARGTWANTISGAVTVTVAGWATYLNITLGADGPAGLLSLNAGDRMLKFAGATWESGQTTGWQALDDVARSEFGYAWIARDGTLTFKNKSWEFTRFLATPTLTVVGTHQGQRAAPMAKRIINAALVRYVPGEQTSTGVVARSTAPISVPGKSFTAAGKWPRNNRLGGYAGNGAPASAPSPGDKIIRLTFADGDGNRTSARDLITPVAQTDYTVNDQQGGGGFNYTLKKQIAVSLAPSGSGVEVSFKNNATGPLWIRDFQVRGTLIQQFSPETITSEDATSIDSYGRRPYTHDLALESGAPFAEAITYFLLYRYAQPVYAMSEVVFEGPEVVADHNLLTTEIGDVISLTEYQTAISAQLYLVRGINYDIKAGGQIINVTFALKRLDQQHYIVFDLTTFVQFEWEGDVFAL